MCIAQTKHDDLIFGPQQNYLELANLNLRVRVLLLLLRHTQGNPPCVTRLELPWSGGPSVGQCVHYRNLALRT